METKKPIPEGRNPRQEVSTVFDLVVCGGGLQGYARLLLQVASDSRPR